MRTGSVLATAVLVMACGGPDSSGPLDNRSVAFVDPPSVLVPGQSNQLQVRVTDAAGGVIAAPEVTLSSSNPAIIRVEGLTINALATGSATLTARSGGASSTANVTVASGGLALPAGNTISVFSGAVELVVPASAVSTPTAVRIQRDGSGSMDPSGAVGSRTSIVAENMTFQVPATLRLAFVAGELPYGLPVSQARIRNITTGSPVAAPGGTVSAATLVAEASVTGGGLFDVGRVPAASCGAGAGEFDFWVGNWNVTSGGQAVGTNDITREASGCAVSEDYRELGGTTGRSITFFEPVADMWYQTYVDSRGSRLRLGGTLSSPGHLVTTSPAAGQTFERWSWTRLSDGSVRQTAERTTNGGATYQPPYWDGLYRRRP